MQSQTLGLQYSNEDSILELFVLVREPSINQELGESFVFGWNYKSSIQRLCIIIFKFQFLNRDFSA